MDAKRSFLQALKRHDLLLGCSRVLLAVSGGPDSMALLHLFLGIPKNKRPQLEIGHFDHGLRGEDSTEDALFVQQQAALLGITCHIAHESDPPNIESSGVEQWARDIRYQWLERLAVSQNCQAVVTAHHADDQAETVLMNIVRGTGLRGLSGMPWRRPISTTHPEIQLLRPLLGIRRAPLLEFLQTHNIPFRTDITNDETGCKRNRTRHLVLPTIEREMNPAVINNLCALAQRCQADEDFLEQMCQKTLGLLAVRTDEGVEISLPVFRSLHQAVRVRVLQSLLRTLSIPSGHSIGRMLSDIELGVFSEIPQEDYSLPVGWVAQKRYDKLIIKPTSDADEDYCFPVTLGVSLPLPCGMHVTCDVLSRAEWADITQKHPGQDSDHRMEGFDLRAIHLPLSIRNRRQGDRMVLEGGIHKKVKDLLMDAKMPRERRRQIPLLVDAHGGILWIVGMRRSAIGWVGDDTEQVLVAGVQ
ncbi:MAG TPA: tRNA lysidine(34) synthetase TilS [bacterium]|nr:tRNA lysidine(34) synthetase TilS [bacterium]